MEQYIFWPVAVLSLLSAMMMLMTPNAVHSALLLVINFFTIAVMYVLLDAEFLAAAQVIVYAGAIMVLFLFVIMLLGVDKLEDLAETIKGHRWATLLLSGALAAGLIFVLRTAFSTTPFTGLADANASGNVEGIGRALFTKYLWPFEITALLLIIAAVGAMVIAKDRTKGDGGEDGR